MFNYQPIPDIPNPFPWDPDDEDEDEQKTIWQQLAQKCVNSYMNLCTKFYKPKVVFSQKSWGVPCHKNSS